MQARLLYGKKRIILKLQFRSKQIRVNKNNLGRDKYIQCQACNNVILRLIVSFHMYIYTQADCRQNLDPQNFQPL